MSAHDDLFGGTAPAGGYCTASCEWGPKDACEEIGGVCIILQSVSPGTLPTEPGWCFRRCEPGVESEDKCFGRDDVACTRFISGVGACLPTCGSHADCGAGRYCDPGAGRCTSEPPAGDPTGSSCSADPTVCLGTCIPLGDALPTCTQRCVLGAADGCAAGVDGASGISAACVAAPYPDARAGDLGWCAQQCESVQDCSNPVARMQCSSMELGLSGATASVCIVE